MKHHILRQDQISVLPTALANYGVVKVKGLGVFFTKQTKARVFKSPATGELKECKPKTKVKFRPSKNLSQYLQSKDSQHSSPTLAKTPALKDNSKDGLQGTYSKDFNIRELLKKAKAGANGFSNSTETLKDNSKQDGTN